MIYCISIVVFLVDQLTKLWAVETLFVHHPVPITSFFNLFLTYNKGVSFSFLATDSHYGPWLLSGISLIVSIGLIIWIQKEKNTLIRTGLAFVLGGALANVVDRIRLGVVVDFLDFHYNMHHWPAFNVADMAICFGAFLIFLQLIIQKKD